jgi:hypothetical protein
MADALSVLGQSAPAASTLTPAYTAPQASTISTINVCNTGSVTDTFRISVAIAGAADTIAQYIAYNVQVKPGSFFSATIGITMASTDVIRVWSLNGTLSFNIFGVQVT